MYSGCSKAYSLIEMKDDVRLIILLSCIVFACSQPGKQREVGKEACIKTNTSFTAVQNVRNAKGDFDVDRFVTMADSLLTTVQGQSISLSYSIDTIKKAEVTKSVLCFESFGRFGGPLCIRTRSRQQAIAILVCLRKLR